MRLVVHRLSLVRLLAVTALLAGCATGASGTPPASASSAPDVGAFTGQHQAVQTEALLPKSVQGRPLVTASLRGGAILDVAAVPATSRANIERALSGKGVKLDDYSIAVASRSDTATDPPSRLYVIRMPLKSSGYLLPSALAAVGWHGLDLHGCDEETCSRTTIAGKPVLAGTTTGIDQEPTQRGAPYWYETEPTTVYIAVTDQPAWAEDAIRQLP